MAETHAQTARAPWPEMARPPARQTLRRRVRLGRRWPRLPRDTRSDGACALAGDGPASRETHAQTARAPWPEMARPPARHTLRRRVRLGRARPATREEVLS